MSPHVLLVRTNSPPNWVVFTSLIAPGATAKRESASDKAKREPREMMDRLRRDSRRER